MVLLIVGQKALCVNTFFQMLDKPLKLLEYSSHVHQKLAFLE